MEFHIRTRTSSQIERSPFRSARAKAARIVSVVGNVSVGPRIERQSASRTSAQSARSVGVGSGLQSAGGETRRTRFGARKPERRYARVVARGLSDGGRVDPGP